MKGSLLKTAFFVVLLTGISAAGAYGQFTISGGFALSRVNAESDGITVEGSVGIGGNVYVDYLLPINIPLSLGGEIGIDSSSLETNTDDIRVLAIPILARAAYHFDLFPKFDLYVVGKIGFAIGRITDGPKNVTDAFDSAAGFAFGIDAGAAYYFTSLVGVFAEVGFDDYMIKAKFKESGGSYSIKTPFYRFITFGLSFKK
ncbi:MAG: porin family protein [Treponema sp.]|jgi:hypothetical protein|nr:porin family protein [Treponema sp.]